MASSVKDAQHANNITGTKAVKTAKLLHHHARPLCVTYLNCNGMGVDWDGQTSGKLQDLQRAGTFDAILLVETHLRKIPVGPEWITTAPTPPGDKSAWALIWLGHRLRRLSAQIESGCIGARPAWTRVRTYARPLLIVAHYVAHFQQTRPSRDDCFDDMEQFL